MICEIPRCARNDPLWSRSLLSGIYYVKLQEGKCLQHSLNIIFFFCNCGSDFSSRSQTVKCGCSSVGRALPCQGSCREFESRHPLHFLKWQGHIAETSDCFQVVNHKKHERHEKRIPCFFRFICIWQWFFSLPKLDRMKKRVLSII